MREMCGGVPVWFAVLLLDYRCCMLLLLQWWWLEIILQVRPPSGKASGSGATLQHDVPMLLEFTVIQLANGWPSHWRVWCWPNLVVDWIWLNSTSIFDIFGQQQCWLRNPHMLMYRCIDQHVSFAWFSFAYYYLTFPVVSGADKGTYKYMSTLLIWSGCDIPVSSFNVSMRVSVTRAMFQEGRMTGEPARLQRRRRIPGRHHEQLQSIK